MSDTLGENGGIYTGTSFSNKTFQGFKLDNTTGDCTVEIIRSNEEDVVVLPASYSGGYIDSGLQSSDEYKALFWSVDAITFRFNNNTGHLEMVVY